MVHWWLNIPFPYFCVIEVFLEHQLEQMKFPRGLWIKHRERAQVKSSINLLQCAFRLLCCLYTDRYQACKLSGSRCKNKFIVMFMLTVVLTIALSLWRSGNVIYFLSGVNTDLSRQAFLSQKPPLIWK